MNLLEFFYPRECPACSDIIETGRLFCPPCLELIHPLPTFERCQKCFAFKGEDHCTFCRKHRIVFQKQGALFESGSPIFALTHQSDKHAKTLAALFTLRLHEEKWPPFDSLYAPPPFKKVAKIMAKAFGLSKPNPKHVLCLAPSLSSFDIPLHLYHAKLSLLALITPD